MAKAKSNEEGKAPKEAGKKGRKNGLSFVSIVLIGIFCSALILSFGFGLRHIHFKSSPSVKNSERLLAMGKPREALEVLNKLPATGKRPGSKAQIHRGKVLYAVLMQQMRQEKWGSYGIDPDNWIKNPLAAEAEQCFLDAMALAPKDPEPRQILGNLYREQGRFADSEIILRSALELDDSNSEAFLTLGLLYAEGGRLEVAHKALMAAWELDEGNAQIAKNIAYFYRFYANVPESSIVWFSRYIDCDPQRDPEINLIRAELRDLLERYPEFEGYRRNPNERVNRGRNKAFKPPVGRQLF